jgi:hypothetical protein
MPYLHTILAYPSKLRLKGALIEFMDQILTPPPSQAGIILQARSIAFAQ